MSPIVSLKMNVKKVFTVWGQERLHQRLLATLNDRMLVDVGFSPELLKQGVSAWPWRLTAESADGPQNQPLPSARPATALYHGDIEFVGTAISAESGQRSRRAA
jgi:hypothetical protein